MPSQKIFIVRIILQGITICPIDPGPSS